MILHKLLFLQLPYQDAEDFAALQAEIIAYPGFVHSSLHLPCPADVSETASSRQLIW
jgi:hypothetical protein